MPRVYPTRTVLARRIRERRLTFEEFVERLEVFARDTNHEVGTVSLHHVQRLTAGLCTAAQLRPATVRLLEKFFESSIDELLAAPDVPEDEESLFGPTGELPVPERDLLAGADRARHLLDRTIAERSVTPAQVDKIDHMVRLHAPCLGLASLGYRSHRRDRAIRTGAPGSFPGNLDSLILGRSA